MTDQAPTSPAIGMWKRRGPSLVAVAVVLAGALGLWIWQTSERESTDDAQIRAHITQIAARVGGAVETIHVVDNQHVAKDTVLLEIDRVTYEVAVERAKAELADADAAAEADATDAKVRQAKAALRQAEINLDHTIVRAPTDGVVSRKSVELGQFVAVGQPLMALVALDDVWVIANFKETQLERMRAGQASVIRVDGLGDRIFHGEVESIAAATSAMFSLFPAENASGNYVKVVQRVPVKIIIDEGQDPDHQLRPGMSVVPTVDVRAR